MAIKFPRPPDHYRCESTWSRTGYTRRGDDHALGPDRRGRGDAPFKGRHLAVMETTRAAGLSASSPTATGSPRFRLGIGGGIGDDTVVATIHRRRARGAGDDAYLACAASLSPRPTAACGSSDRRRGGRPFHGPGAAAAVERARSARQRGLEDVRSAGRLDQAVHGWRG
jgi:hypothetical protein